MTHGKVAGSQCHLHLVFVWLVDEQEVRPYSLRRCFLKLKYICQGDRYVTILWVFLITASPLKSHTIYALFR